MDKLFGAFVGCFLLSAAAHAAIFDSADFLKQGGHSVGAAGDIVLNDPSGEGLEGRYKWGTEEYINLEGILGIGSDTRRFHVGTQVDYNFIPDISGQPGVSAIAGATLMKRTVGDDRKTALVFTLGPLIHKQVDGLNGLPMILYLGLPWSLNFQTGSYYAATQLAFGALTDVTRNHAWYFCSEAAMSLSKSESYILVGLGMRFTGFDNKSSATHEDRHEKRKLRPTGKGKDDEEEFQTDDFKR
jgi:hypothetical protein